MPSAHPKTFGHPLRGQLGELWRYRVGPYRILCRIEEEVHVVLVVAAGHQKDIYR